MTALDALFAKADAFEGMKTPEWAYWADHFVNSMNGGEIGVAPATSSPDATGHAMTARLVRDLDTAETFYVSPEMNRLVTAAAESWVPEEKIWMEDFPSPVGWIWIPGGLTRLDIRGQLVTTSAISWHVTGGTVVLTFWTDKVHDSPHQRGMPGWDLMPRLSPWHVMVQPLAAPLVLSIQMGTLLPPEVSEQISWIKSPDGKSLTAAVPTGWSAEELTPTAQPDPVTAWLVSAMRIMATPLADVKRQGLPANVRKSLLRRPFRFKEKAVTVILFRRRLGDNTTMHRDFSHRFLRRGHWRKQWMGNSSEKSVRHSTLGDPEVLPGDHLMKGGECQVPGCTRRQVRIWIHPTIVGPSDKPFILRQHVNALTR